MLFIVTTTLDLHLEGGVTYTYPTLQTQIFQVVVISATRITFLEDIKAHSLRELRGLA